MTTGAAFVAGATGFVGRETVRALAANDVCVIAHVRPDSTRISEWRERFGDLGAQVDTTAWQLDALTERFAAMQPTAVFALLGTTRKRGRSEGLANPYELIDYGLTSMLIKATVAAKCQARFVYLSSAGIGANPRSPYMKARFKAERELHVSGLAYTIARPSFITGPGRDDNRMGERVGAAFADSALKLASLVGARKLRSRYRSTTNTTLGATLATLAFDATAVDSIVEGDQLR